MIEGIPIELQKHDFKALCKEARRLRKLDRRGPVSVRRGSLYFSINIDEGGELAVKYVRLGRLGEITRHDAVLKADAMFKDYKQNGVIPWSRRLQRERDVAKIPLRKRQWYVDKYSEQSGKCAICDQPSPHLYIDHCHDTGVLRALLCARCNSGIGQLQDDPELLRKAALYIENFKHQSVTQE